MKNNHGKGVLAGIVLAAELREAAVKEVDAGEIPQDTRPLPYLDQDGSVVIPFGSDPRFHWWNFGQLPSETEKEVRGWRH